MSVLDLVPGHSQDDPTSAGDVDVDDVWEIFRNHRRRRVIQYAATMNHDEVVALGVLADRLTAREHGDEYSAGDRKCVYNSLYQIHLEKLDDVDAVDYDPDRGVVRPGAQVGRLADALAAVEEVLEG